MLDIDESIKTAIESWSNSKNLTLYIGENTFENRQLSEGSVSLKQGLTQDSTYTIGNTICSELDFSIINVSGKYKASDIVDQRVKVKLTIDRNEETEKELYFGEYNCDRPENNSNGKIDVIAYDDIIKLEKNADEFLNTINFPIELREFMIKICEYAGISQNIGTDIVNATFSIKSRPDSQKLTLRNLMNNALTIAAGNGIINPLTNNFEVKYLTKTGYTINDSVHVDSLTTSSFHVADYTGVVAYNSENKAIIYGSKTNVYYIDNNDLIYDNTDEEIVNMIANVLNTIKDAPYVPFEMKLKRGLLFLQPGDIITVRERVGSEYYLVNVPILDRTLTGIYKEDELKAGGSIDTNSYTSDNITSSQVNSIINNLYNKYSLTSTKRYLNSEGTEVEAMGMYHSNVGKELIFKPIFEGEKYIGMQTNFSDSILNTDLLGEDPDMTRIDTEDE
jgi:hypothetical protein